MSAIKPPERFSFTIEIAAVSKEEAEAALKIITQLGEPFGFIKKEEEA